MNKTCSPGCDCPCCCSSCPYCTLITLFGQFADRGVSPDAAATLAVDFVEWVGNCCPYPMPADLKIKVTTPPTPTLPTA